MKRFAITIAMGLAVAVLASSSLAAEARPWLCRQIPVFSAAKPMTWSAKRRGGGQWLMTFMRYDPAGGHDGFTLVSSRQVGAGTSGTLEAGQWYAVALYRASGHWICPANASEEDKSGSSAIANLCYGRDEDSCDVNLTVE
jgi:hypothetical protein